jgi:dethiobiotin synthetase
VLVEGVGGVMVPLDDHNTVRDWIVALDLPVLLVAGTYLGSVSHTLTALAALREGAVRPAAIVVNESAESVGMENTRASLAAHVDRVPLIALPRNGSDAAFDTLANLTSGPAA